MNPAFEFLRKHKQVTYETESLVMKKVSGRINHHDLFTAFENGISGSYGKVYSLDPQTLIGWVDSFLKSKNSDKNYYSAGLIPVNTPITEPIEWDKEANKCYTAYLNGISEDNFHPGVYDRCMLDGNIKINSYMKYYIGPDGVSPDDKIKWSEVISYVTKAKQLVLRDYFASCKQKGFSFIYFIK
jgi:hypothetical protein